MEARNPSSGTRQSLSCDGAGLLGSARVRLDRTEGWGQGASRESWCLLEEQKMKKENARLPGEATASLWSLHSLPAHHALCPLLGEEQPRILDVSEVTGTSTSPCPAPSFPPPAPPHEDSCRASAGTGGAERGGQIQSEAEKGEGLGPNRKGPTAVGKCRRTRVACS